MKLMWCMSCVTLDILCFVQVIKGTGPIQLQFDHYCDTIFKEFLLKTNLQNKK